MRRSIAGLGIAVALGLLACGGPSEDGAAHEATTRALMKQIFEGIRVALPEATGAEPFSDPARHDDVAAALVLLADNAEGLARHTRDEDAEARFLARSVARDARDLQRAHAIGRLDRAAFLTRQITENCIACHARLPDAKAHPMAEAFIDSAAVAALPPEDRVALQMATRRFDDAIATLESRLLGTEHPALLIGPLTDYLVLSIRVRDDYAGPARVLARFAERPELWTALREDVAFWVASLPVLHERAKRGADLALGRELVTEARMLEPFPGSHRSLAHYVVASSVLERWIDTRADSDAATAEAFYLRGLIEGAIGRNYWVTSAPFLLETAIRIAPGEPLAGDAYALLEQETLLAYEGAEGEISAEDQARLAELRGLIEAARR